MSHELIFNERNITDEEIVNAAEMNQELSFHAPPPSVEQEEEIEDDEWERPEVFIISDKLVAILERHLLPLWDEVALGSTILWFRDPTDFAKE